MTATDAAGPPPLAVASVITRATVFPDRAQVFRCSKTLLAPGDHTLHFDGLWDEADRDTLQFAVSDASDGSHAAVTLSAVQFATVHQGEDVAPLRETAAARLTACERALRGHRDSVALHNTAIAAYEAVMAKATAPHTTVAAAAAGAAPTQPALRYSVARQQQMAAMCRDGHRRHTAERRFAERAVARGELDAAAAKRDLQDLGKGRRTSRDVAEVKLHVGGTQDVTLGLTLSYVVRNASWEAVYDLRVDKAERTMQVAYGAMVRQATGEEWADVQLELSTAKPQASAAAPDIVPWRVSICRPPTPPPEGDHRLKKSMMMLAGCPPPKARCMPMANMMQTCEEAAVNDGEADTAPPRGGPGLAAPRIAAAAVTAAAAAMTFRVALPVSLMPTGKPTRVAISIIDLPVHLRYSCVPKLNPLVYLKARATNTSPYQLLPGKANVFAGHELVSTTAMDHVSPDEEFWTFLGTDADIRCSRQRAETTTAKVSGLFGADTTRHDVRSTFTCSSTKRGRNDGAAAAAAAAVELAVWDQYPVPDHKTIVVTPLRPAKDSRTTAGRVGAVGAAGGRGASGPSEAERLRGEAAVAVRHEVSDTQLVEWLVELKGQSEVRWDFEYSLVHPADQAMTNAWDLVN